MKRATPKICIPRFSTEERNDLGKQTYLYIGDYSNIQPIKCPGITYLCQI